MPTSDHEYKSVEFQLEGVLKQKHSEMNTDCRQELLWILQLVLNNLLFCLKSHYYWPTLKWISSLRPHLFRSYQCLSQTCGAIFILKLKTNWRKKKHHLHVKAAQQQETIGLDSNQSLHHRQNRPKKGIHFFYSISELKAQRKQNIALNTTAWNFKRCIGATGAIQRRG